MKGKITDLKKRQGELTTEDTKLSNQITELTTKKQELKINYAETKNEESLTWICIGFY